MDDAGWAERDEDIHVPNRAGVAGSGKRGGSAEGRICGVSDAKAEDFHTRLTLSNNVVTVNL